MINLRALIYIEIDIKFCELEYGVAPCTASGTEKCFNTRNQSADCQDPANFTPGTKTLRFGLNDRPLPASIPCIPLLLDAEVTNARVMPGESIGERATLRATFANSRHGDAGIDPYIISRDYNPFNQGSFWGKFRARNTYLEARPIRIYRGYMGQTLKEMDCEHFVIDKMQGPDASGNVTISGVDFMRLLNSEKAQAPAPNNGYLSLPLDVSSTSITLLPTGIGDAEYPASGTASLGKETVTFTRTGDDFTIVRGVGNSVADEHDDGEVLQLMLEYTSQNAAAIVNDLVVNYSPLDVSYTDLPAWGELVTSFADVLYSCQIPKPTPVVELLNELIEQAGLVVFGNTRTQKIVFDVLRPNPVTGRAIGPDEILGESFQQIDQPKKRFSQVWVFYGKRDIYEGDEPANFYSAVILPVADNQYETPSIKKIFSKWIPSGSRSVATNVAERAISRFKFPPLKLRFSLFAQNFRQLGQVVRLADPSLETATGAQAELDAIITGWKATPERNDFEAEEYNIDAEIFVGPRKFQFDYDTNNLNMREYYDVRHSSFPDGVEIIFIINTGVVNGSNSTSQFAIETGDWPAGVVPKLVVRPAAFVVGRGGNGGYAATGQPGGPALRVTSPIEVDNQGTIGGGGGGGGGSKLATSPYTSFRGAGGAGSVPGSGDGPGSLEYGGISGATSGSSGVAGSGGDLGRPGTSGTGGGVTRFGGGAAGTAIEGDSLITYINEGTILGARIG